MNTTQRAVARTFEAHLDRPRIARPLGRRGQLDRDLAAILVDRQSRSAARRSNPAAACRTIRRARGWLLPAGRTGRSARCRPGRWRKTAGSARATAAARFPIRAPVSGRAPPSGCADRRRRRPMLWPIQACTMRPSRRAAPPRRAGRPRPGHCRPGRQTDPTALRRRPAGTARKSCSRAVAADDLGGGAAKPPGQGLVDEQKPAGAVHRIKADRRVIEEFDELVALVADHRLHLVARGDVLDVPEAVAGAPGDRVDRDVEPAGDAAARISATASAAIARAPAAARCAAARNRRLTSGAGERCRDPRQRRVSSDCGNRSRKALLA